jgi:hypothetical protein
MEHSEGLNAFSEILEDMAASPVVMSAKKIKTLLKCVAYYDELKTAVEIAKDGFDYESAMKRCYAEFGNSASFRMPVGIKDKIAIVLGLLLEFDEGERDFYDFIVKCFPAESAVDSYILFCIKVLRPFKNAMIELVEHGDAEDLHSKINEVDFASGGLQDQTEYFVLNIVDEVKAANIDNDERADLLCILEGFAAAIDSRDSLMIRSLWLGLKKALVAQKLAAPLIPKLEQALRLYLVIK